MGWSFSCEPRHDRKAVVAELNHLGEGHALIAHRVVGCHLWQVVERKSDGIKHIHLYLMQKGAPGEGWGWKGISEQSGPYFLDCPETLLAMCSPPENEYAAGWRAKVREFHAKRKAAPKPVHGLVVPYGGARYELMNNLGGKKGWVVKQLDCENVTILRMGSQILARALREM